eukprot:PhM_4_TR645/c0_g1_i3/m.18729
MTATPDIEQEVDTALGLVAAVAHSAQPQEEQDTTMLVDLLVMISKERSDSRPVSASATNYALVFIKPHAAEAEPVKQTVLKMLADAKIRAVKEGVATHDVIDAERLIDKHYASIARNALDTNPADLQISDKAQDAFAAKFGVAWSEAISSGRVLNAKAGMARVGGDISGLDFEANWRKAGPVKLGPGLYVSQLDGDDVFVVNGFYPAAREKFTRPGARVVWFVVSWSEADLTWEAFRGKVIGATDPTKAPADSIRGVVYHQWRALGLDAQPDMGNNTVHASAGPLEGLTERVVWTGADIASDVFGAACLSSSLHVEHIKELMSNPSVPDPTKPPGAMTPVFDVLEDKQTTECLKLMNMITAQLLSKPSPPPVTPPAAAQEETVPAPAPAAISAPPVPVVGDPAKLKGKKPPALPGGRPIVDTPCLPESTLAPKEVIFSEAELKTLEKNKIMLKMENERYLRDHPEVRVVLTRLMKDVIRHEPEHPVDYIEKRILSTDLHVLYKEEVARAKASFGHTKP